MREIEVDADEFAFKAGRQFLHQLRLGQARGPFFERFERYEKFGNERSVRVGRVFATALLGDDRAHRRIACDYGADLVDGIPARIERNRGRKQRADPEIPFFQLGQEFRAQAHPESAAKNEKGECNRRRDARILHRQNENTLVHAANVAHEKGFNLRYPVRQQK